MAEKGKDVIINVGFGKWYERGTQRLVDSLKKVGWDGDILTWNDWPSDKFGRGNVYTIKPAAFQEAIDKGYENILWLDSSVWAIRNPEPLFDIIREDGHYFWKSGFWCSQVCHDKCLEYFGVDRDTAATYLDCYACMMGLNAKDETSKKFLDRWFQAAKDGVFEGSWHHDGQSGDPRFLFYRHDQSCASVILNKLGMYIHDPNIYSDVYHNDLNESVIFVAQGM